MLSFLVKTHVTLTLLKYTTSSSPEVMRDLEVCTDATSTGCPSLLQAHLKSLKVKAPVSSSSSESIMPTVGDRTTAIKNSMPLEAHATDSTHAKNAIPFRLTLYYLACDAPNILMFVTFCTIILVVFFVHRNRQPTGPGGRNLQFTPGKQTQKDDSCAGGTLSQVPAPQPQRPSSEAVKSPSKEAQEGSPSTQRCTQTRIAAAQGITQDRLSTFTKRTANLKALHLCPGLVVPKRTECLLAVQVCGSSTRDILDLTGHPVLKVEVNKTAHQQLSATKGIVSEPVVILKTPCDPSRSRSAHGEALIYCYLQPQADGRNQINLCNPGGRLFCQLLRDPVRKRFVLLDAEHGEVNMVFDGTFKEEHMLLITDDNQEESLADAEQWSMPFDQAGQYFRLRVSPNVDAGIVLCCLFSIEVIKNLEDIARTH
jgi:hypothetical protein